MLVVFFSYRFTSNQDENDQRSILHTSSNTFHQQKCFVFVIFICNYPGGSHVAAANWLRKFVCSVLMLLAAGFAAVY